MVDGGYGAALERLRERYAATQPVSAEAAAPADALVLVHAVLTRTRRSAAAGTTDREVAADTAATDTAATDTAATDTAATDTTATDTTATAGTATAGTPDAGIADAGGAAAGQPDAGESTVATVDGAGTQPVAAEDMLAALLLLRHLRDELAGWEPELVTAARGQAVSWASLAPALGVTSRQAAERRYLRLQPSATGERNREDRVRAERTRRAGDRAVAIRARENSGVLRRLAGQISALDGLPEPAQRRVDIVHRALADDDPANLLAPLAGTHHHLEAAHSGLAEQVRSVTEQTEQLRRDTTSRRAAPQQ